jgi:hypothetical protein
VPSDPENWLLVTRLREVAARLGAATTPDEADPAWADADRAVADAGAGEDPVAALPVLVRDLDALRALLEAWDGRQAALPERDQAVLRRAMNAYKKRLKILRVDDEASSSRNPLSRGARSAISGIRPPEAYGEDVWALLVAHGRLRDAGHGLLEPAGESS